ncbi:synapsin-1-like [Suricata suricatta]|uniref:synapsin-1-like n=1 Tax=Suricata suricatta TaxID=37032 RepID=UPI0011554427|nr:synapsin-1-like [Suricata suricatta]
MTRPPTALFGPRTPRGSQDAGSHRGHLRAPRPGASRGKPAQRRPPAHPRSPACGPSRHRRRQPRRPPAHPRSPACGPSRHRRRQPASASTHRRPAGCAARRTYDANLGATASRTEEFGGGAARCPAHAPGRRRASLHCLPTRPSAPGPAPVGFCHLQVTLPSPGCRISWHLSFFTLPEDSSWMDLCLLLSSLPPQTGPRPFWVSGRGPLHTRYAVSFVNDVRVLFC